MFIEPIRLLGSLRGSLGTYGLTQKLCLKKDNWVNIGVIFFRAGTLEHIKILSNNLMFDMFETLTPKKIPRHLNHVIGFC